MELELERMKLDSTRRQCRRETWRHSKSAFVSQDSMTLIRQHNEAFMQNKLIEPMIADVTLQRVLLEAVCISIYAKQFLIFNALVSLP